MVLFSEGCLLSLIPLNPPIKPVRWVLSSFSSTGELRNSDVDSLPKVMEFVNGEPGFEPSYWVPESTRSITTHTTDTLQY